MDNDALKDVKDVLKSPAGLSGMGIFQPQPSAWSELIKIVETKNSWGKNEIKDEILKILAKFNR